MVIALDPKGTFPYVLESERASSSPTTWRIKLLTGRELELVRRQAESPESLGVEDIDNVLRLVLRGWVGYRDEAGAEMPFPGTGPDQLFGAAVESALPQCLDRFPLSFAERSELMKAALHGAQLRIDDAKKS